MSISRTFKAALAAILIIIVVLSISEYIYNVPFDLGGKIKPTPTPNPTPTVTPTPTASPLPLSVAKSFLQNGICYGPFRDGQSPDVAIYPSVEQVKEDLESIKQVTNNIRTYSATNISADIPSIAHLIGLHVYQGVYLSTDLKHNQAEIQSAENIANQNLVDSIIVGNELLLNGTLSENEIIQYIHEVKQNVPKGVTVTTAEPWSEWISHPNLAKEVDYLLIHVHPYWEDQTVENAAQYVIDCYNKVSETYPDKSVEIGETGWPSAGNSNWTGVSAQTLANQANQHKFIENFAQLANRNSIKYFYFDAFDEEYKWNERKTSGNVDALTLPLDRTFSGNMAGSSWGIFQSNGKLKPLLADLFVEVSPVNSRATREVFSRGNLSSGYDVGVDDSGQNRNWLSSSDGSMCMSYPSGQSWGAVFLTVGKPVDPPRPWKDFSEFQTLYMELKGEVGGEFVRIGIKDASDPDDGTEVTFPTGNLGTEWQTYSFSLSSFSSSETTKLYVVAEFVFDGSTAQTVYFRNIQYV